MNRFPFSVLVLLLFVGCGGSTTPPAAPVAEASFEWHEWNVDSFEQARREGKLVLVDVGIEGCTACRWMFEDTYQHPEVVRRLRESFVVIAVDANLRPDLGERYARWGWPATIFLTAEGTQVLALRGNKRPQNFIGILDELLERRAQGDLGPDAEPIAVSELADEGAFGAMCRAATDRLDRMRNDAGGWGRFRTVQAPLARHALLRAHARGEEERLPHLVRTSHGYGRMIDPVWGGLFVGARNADWTGVIPEKRTKHNAGAMQIIAETYDASGDAELLPHLSGIHRYFEDFMSSERGTFFATQEDEAPGLPGGLSASDYYAMSDAERRRYGVPPIDHAEYTDLNAMVIEAYARWYEATGEGPVLARARRAADVLLAERMTGAGYVLQSAPSEVVTEDDRMRAFGREDRAFLRPQGQFGLALLALYRVSAEPAYLAAAERIGEGLRALEAADGGFFSATPDGTEGLVPPTKPALDNAIAARFLLELSFYTKNDAFRESAERALGAVARPETVSRRGAGVVAELALALDSAGVGPVEFSLVGPRDDEASTALFAAALEVYEPRKVLHFDTTDRYPAEDVPVMYICTREACSSPIRNPEDIAEIASRFAQVSGSAPCQ
ncbi:MAG: DUF255 domain-containing protein [Myxococcota bacterium]